jgi:glycerol kinase
MIGRIAAIDQGTTSTRALVLQADGTVTLVHSLRHAQHRPQAGWLEHDPAELLRAIRLCLQAAGPVDAIGLANQGESCLAWDAITGEPYSPVIVWQDQRTENAIARLRAAGAEALVAQRAGLRLDPYFSAAKLAWLLTHIPQAGRAHAAGRLRLGTTDAFFLQHLTGRCVTDASTASRTSLMNLATLQWDPDLCALFGVPIATLPPICPTIGDFGAIAATPLTASVVDQQAALYGHGCRSPGDIKITFGTGAFVLAPAGAEPPVSASLSPTVAWQLPAGITYALEGGVLDGGSAVEWLHSLDLFGDYAELDTFDAPPALQRGLVFAPALSGLAAPRWDRTAAGAWLGLTPQTSRRDLCQAVIEGIALATAELVEAIGPVTTVSIDGGLTRSAYFRQFLSDRLGHDLILPICDELTAAGCAALAAAGIGRDVALPPGGVLRIASRSCDRERWRIRFADAIERVRGWTAHKT